MDFSKVFSFERTQFLLTGVYPLHQPRSYQYNLKASLVFFFSLLLPTSMIIKLIIGVDSLEEFADILYYLTTNTAYLCKLVNFFIGAQSALYLEQQVKLKLPEKYYNHFGTADLKQIVKVAYVVGFIYRLSIFGAIALYALFPLFGGDRQIPFAGWIPVDVNIKVYQWIVYVIQMVSVSVCGATNGNLDILTIYYTSIGIAHLKMIKRCLRNVDYSLRNLENGKHIAGGKKLRNKAISPDNLNELLEFHKYILNYFSVLEEVFSNGIFVQFFASIGVVCLSGFQLMITPVMSGQFLMLVAYLCCMLCQVTMYCWFGNEVLFESDGIGESCYMSNWYEGTQDDKKCLYMIMERSKRQTQLTAGKFFIMSLPTLVMIMKSSYSYFAVLQRLYTDK